MDGHLWKRAALCSVGLAALFVAGCGGGRMTAGEACSQMGEATCSRQVECDSAANKGMCISDFQTACCGGEGTCGMEVANDQEEMLLKAIIDSCSMAIDNYDCAALASGELPLECFAGAASSALTAAPQARLAPRSLPARVGLARQSLDPRVLGRQAGLRLLSR